MANYTATGFNLDENQKAERKLLVTCVNTGTSLVPVWTIVGAGVEDSSIEYNVDSETITDILSNTETTVNKLEMKQTLEPMTIRGGSALAIKLIDIVERKALSEFALFEVLVIRAYISETTGGASPTFIGYHAEKHINCTVVPTSEGGNYYVDMPIEITLSNNKTLGTVNDYRGTITFTPNVSGLTVTSVAGATTGTTTITASPTLTSGNSYLYFVSPTQITLPDIGNQLNDAMYTGWNGSTDITALSGMEIAVIEITSTGVVFASGKTTVVSNTGD